MLSISSQKVAFDRQEVPHAFLKKDGHLPLTGKCMAHTNNFFLIIFIFVKKTKFSLIQIDNN